MDDASELSRSITVPHSGVAFTSRPGGVSRGSYEGLNLSFDVGDEEHDVFTNRRRVSDYLGIGGRPWISVKQMHGSKVHVVDDDQGSDGRVEADAIISRVSGVLAVMVADCGPIAIQGADGFAVVHGGWRSLSAGILDVVCDQISADIAWVGPCIHPCHYEVGREVSEAFAKRFPGVRLRQDPEGSFDLPGAVTALLEANSVDVAYVSPACTGCDEDLYSYRRSPTTGRQAVVMWR